MFCLFQKLKFRFLILKKKKGAAAFLDANRKKNEPLDKNNTNQKSNCAISRFIFLHLRHRHFSFFFKIDRFLFKTSRTALNPLFTSEFVFFFFPSSSWTNQSFYSVNVISSVLVAVDTVRMIRKKTKTDRQHKFTIINTYQH